LSLVLCYHRDVWEIS